MNGSIDVAPLVVLENAGLVTSERHGQRVLYRLTADNLVNTLTGFALEICPVAGPLKRSQSVGEEPSRDEVAPNDELAGQLAESSRCGS